MTREEAIKFAVHAQSLADLPEVKEFYAFAESALREQEERRWIPVTERLPEPGERVLATDGRFVGELYVNSRGQWQRYNVNDHSLLMALDILWWMPIPEPPKGE